MEPSQESWSFLTYARVRPASLKETKIRYAISNQSEISTTKSFDNKNFKVLSLSIPEGSNPSLIHCNPTGVIPFTFNDVFDSNATQEDIFVRVQQLILDIFSGMNSTILAYGQTGAGKTYTICGGDTYETRGLIPRALTLVFNEMTFRNDTEDDITCKCLISFCEVFGESVYDLLDTQHRNKAIEEWPEVQIIDNEDGIILKNINVYEVNAEEEALNLFFLGTTNR
jgi:kinesin family protein 6/9